jgi:ABC-type lipoprotein export system ATPase subunit
VYKGSYESKGVGVNWSNINEPVSVNDTLTFTHLMLISLSTNFFHLLIFFYLEQINPGDNGIAKKWYFPIQCLFPSRKTSEDSFMVNKIYDSTKERTDSSQVFIESDEVYATRKAGIKINNITKVFKQFGKLKTAVNDLSFKIYENHITVLLGHNGAGKSTTISMITGIASPTKGQILVNDHDIVNETQLARKQIGYCPQYNLLFDEMTVLEHLVFFSKLKENYDPKEIENILTDLNLSDKTNALSRTLSGGMKRKLSVAIAFIGGSKIVILDEPTSGKYVKA